MSINWNEDNLLGTGALTKNTVGLTELGKEYVKRLEQKNIIIDISHSSEQTFWDTIKNTTGTIVARDGKTTIDRETETDENGYITVVYPENTTAVKVELIGQIEKTAKIELVNNKFIEIVSDLDMIQIIKTTKQVNFENNNKKQL